jgi:hypothetical protein
MPGRAKQAAGARRINEGHAQGASLASQITSTNFHPKRSEGSLPRRASRRGRGSSLRSTACLFSATLKLSHLERSERSHAFCLREQCMLTFSLKAGSLSLKIEQWNLARERPACATFSTNFAGILRCAQNDTGAPCATREAPDVLGSCPRKACTLGSA